MAYGFSVPKVDLGHRVEEEAFRVFFQTAVGVLIFPSQISVAVGGRNGLSLGPEEGREASRGNTPPTYAYTY